MNLHGLRTVCYKVNDIARAKSWYSQVLGIEPYFDEPFYVGFNVAGYELGLQPVELATDLTSGKVIAYWAVDDVQATFDTLITCGAIALEQPIDVGGGLILASVSDPWGNAFGIIYNPHFVLPENKKQ